MKILVLTALSLTLAGAAYYFWQQHHLSPPQEIILYGNVDVRQVDLGFRIPGRVTALYVEEGDQVAPGKLLAELDKEPYATQVIEAAASLASAKVTLGNTEKVLKRRQELVGEGSVSKEDLDNAMANHAVQKALVDQSEAALAIARTNLSFTELFAPSEGSVLTRIREIGAVVSPTESVYTVSLTTPVWIRAFCTGPQLGLIYPGMKAHITTDTPGGKAYVGQVGFISPVAEFTPKSVETTELRTDLVYRLRIYVDNSDRNLRQGSPVTVRLDLKQAD